MNNLVNDYNKIRLISIRKKIDSIYKECSQQDCGEGEKIEKLNHVSFLERRERDIGARVVD